MYLAFVRWTDKMTQQVYNDVWKDKHAEICKKWGVKLLKWGIPFGTVETHVFVYDTDLELSKYQDFRADVSAIVPGAFDWTNTTIVNCPQ